MRGTSAADVPQQTSVSHGACNSQNATDISMFCHRSRLGPRPERPSAHEPISAHGEQQWAYVYGRELKLVSTPQTTNTNSRLPQSRQSSKEGHKHHKRDEKNSKYYRPEREHGDGFISWINRLETCFERRHRLEVRLREQVSVSSGTRKLREAPATAKRRQAFMIKGM